MTASEGLPVYQVRLTEGARGDLEDIHRYAEKYRSAKDADALLDALLAKVETLETFPGRGKVPKELEMLGMQEFREILLLPYRLIYRIMDKVVFIMVIADGRRDMQTLLEQRLLRR